MYTSCKTPLKYVIGKMVTKNNELTREFSVRVTSYHHWILWKYEVWEEGKKNKQKNLPEQARFSENQNTVLHTLQVEKNNLRYQDFWKEQFSA